jgi:hypothetical protein
MIPCSQPPGFQEAIEASLAHGERLVIWTDCYTENWQDVWVAAFKQYVRTFSGFSWMTIALTNINLRVITWQQEKVKTGFLSSKTIAVPVIYSNTAAPLAQITAMSLRQFTPVKAVNKALAKTLGTDAGGVTAINFQSPGARLDCASPYNEFFDLAKKLEAHVSGALLAAQSSGVSDALERLAALKQEGVLTDEEFERAKSGFVGATVEVAESSASLLRQLHALYQGGVLSQAEFNMKKWDILSRPG